MGMRQRRTRLGNKYDEYVEAQIASPDELKKAFETWLELHELDRDSRVYTKAEWDARGEKFPLVGDAVIHIIAEGPLYSVVNGPHDSQALIDFNIFVRELGLMYEFFKPWSLHFFPIRIYRYPWGPATLKPNW